MSALIERLREELQDREYREGYDEAFLDHRIASQIRVIREQRGITQKQLAIDAGMRQSRISAIEDKDYGSWSINTLRRIAYALGVRLNVSFEEWGTLLDDIDRSGRADLQRLKFGDDPAFREPVTRDEAAIGQKDNVIHMTAFLLGDQAARKPPHSVVSERLYGDNRGTESSGVRLFSAGADEPTTEGVRP